MRLQFTIAIHIMNGTAAVLAALAVPSHNRKDTSTMDKPIMTPILVREKVAQYICSRAYLDEYRCTSCGKTQIQCASIARRSPRCRTCSNTKHGMKRDPRHAVWAGMKTRATNTNRSDAHLYVSRGIGICDEWMTFEGFARWEKFDQYKPGLQIDRIDNNKGYGPDNCRWVSCRDNARNKRCNVLRKQDISVIRMLCLSGLTHRQTASIFGVSASLISQVQSHKVWVDA